MKTYNKPSRKQWSALSERPTIDQEQLAMSVKAILDDVKQNGDKAVFKYTSILDRVELSSFEVTEQEFAEGDKKVPEVLRAAIKVAYDNIYKFHKAQQKTEDVVETTVGVKCWRKSVSIDKVGLYIPGGSAPLFSTILMLGIPAQIAGCKEVILCTPPSQDKSINPAILFAAKLVGITKVYKVGGSQAIAAMGYGTESIPQVYKIFGPGNQYVTKAKEIIQQKGVAIDMPAGPSEVLVIADNTCNPSFVAADLLSQAEHGPDSQVVLLSDDVAVIEQCMVELREQTKLLPREEVVNKALLSSKAIVLNTLNECVEFSNYYAPEHLIIASTNASLFVNDITNAGSVFLGNYSCESAGDYASGTNHTLPTNGFAKNYSGVSLDSFVKKITFQELTTKGIENIGEVIEVMAEAEGLIAHKNAVTLRLKAINND